MVVLVVYFWFRGRDRDQKERRELRKFSIPERGPRGLAGHWEGDLVAMTATFDPFDPDSVSDGADDDGPVFSLRRLQDGQWNVCLIASSNEGGNAERQLPRDVAGPLESQYQRFLLHWREG